MVLLRGAREEPAAGGKALQDIYIYLYMCVSMCILYTYVYIYIHIHISRCLVCTSGNAHPRHPKAPRMSPALPHWPGNPHAWK